jgi:putative ABC transport system permease protein
MNDVIEPGWGLGAAVLLLTVTAAVVGATAGLGTGRAAAVAVGRAVLQLAVVSLVIVAVLRSWPATVAFVLVMLIVAAWTAGRRMTRDRSGLGAGLALLAGTVPVMAVVLGTGAVPLTGIAVVPVAGIVIGGAMTATALAGRRALDRLTERRGEYEAALSLGLVERDAAVEVIRSAGHDALVPALDQTRTVGLVTLPGAFVGVLLGSGDPVQAGAAQLLVLAGLLAAETVAALVTMELVARGRIRRPSPSAEPPNRRRARRSLRP